MTATLTVTIPRDYWLTANRTVVNHGYRRRIIDALHELTIAAAERQGFPAAPSPCIASWTVRYPKGVRTDKGEASNALPTTKAILDALCPRWLADDGPIYVTEERFRRGPNLDVQGAHVVILRLLPDGESGSGVAVSNGRIGGISEGPRIAAETPLDAPSERSIG